MKNQPIRPLPPSSRADADREDEFDSRLVELVVRVLLGVAGGLGLAWWLVGGR